MIKISYQIHHLNLLTIAKKNIVYFPMTIEAEEMFTIDIDIAITIVITIIIVEE